MQKLAITWMDEELGKRSPLDWDIEKTYSYGGKTFEVPSFSPDEGLIFTPEPREPPQVIVARPDDKDSQPEPMLLQHMFNIWDTQEFQHGMHRPLDLGILSEDCQAPFACCNNVPRVLDMPLKFPGSHEYRVPKTLEPFLGAIKQIASYERFLNPHALDFHCYLTLDMGYIKPGEMQRHPGVHVDGFQVQQYNYETLTVFYVGERISPKVVINHSYLVSNTLPTVFYLQPFTTSHLDPAKDNFFLDFEKQCGKQREWKPVNFGITLMNAYCVHRGDTLPSDTPVPVYRTILRLSYDVRQFDRLGNAHNPLFEYDWPMVARELHLT